jgi:hypothetical protein
MDVAKLGVNDVAFFQFNRVGSNYLIPKSAKNENITFFDHRYCCRDGLHPVTK